VLVQKLPITNRIVKFNKNFEVTFSFDLKEEGEMISAAQSKGIIYYLLSNKKMTVFDIEKQRVAEVALETKAFPHLVEPYQAGVVFPQNSNFLTYFTYDFEVKAPKYESLEIKSLSIGGNMSLKFSETGIYTLNENGIHYYDKTVQKTYTQSLFSITNCGISFNGDGDMLAVADFGGSVHIFPATQPNGLPSPLFSVFVGIPIRSIVWCDKTNNIVIGCVGGSLFWWRFGQPDADLIMQIDHTFNILRAVDSKIYAGTSLGEVKIFDANTMALISEYTAHHPVHYETE
jgi:WD40 repeat protein